LSPLAVRLLQLRAYARSEPERPAHEVIEPTMLAVVAQRVFPIACHDDHRLLLDGGGTPRWLVFHAPMMVPPFWRTTWKGWLSLQTFLEGVHFAFHLRL
jgi:hypothetical protein